MARRLLLEFHPTTERPSRSCRVIYINRFNEIVTTNYSKVHDAFNSFDELDKTEEDRADWEEYVKAWAYADDKLIGKKLRGILREIYR